MIEQIEFQAMGCHMLAATEISAGRSARLLKKVPDWFENWEECLSRFRPDSELSQINNKPGIPSQVSKTLWSVLQVALKAEGQSDGLVTPVLLDALMAAGYVTTFDQLKQGGGGLKLAQKPAPPAYSLWDVVFEPEKRTVSLPVGLRLDLGGVAKGWAAHHTMRRLEHDGPALVDAGGDIAVSGLRSESQPWLVGIDDPRQEDESLGTLRLGRCGVATSGRDYRRWRQDGRWNHHIIDPRTGEPAITDVLTATVIARNVMQAEMAAKVVLILGSHDGLSWLEQHDGYAGVVVTDAGEVITSFAFKNMDRGRNGFRKDKHC